MPCSFCCVIERAMSSINRCPLADDIRQVGLCAPRISSTILLAFTLPYAIAEHTLILDVDAFSWRASRHDV